MNTKEIEKCVAKCIDKIQKTDGVSSVAIAVVHKNIPGFCIKGNPNHLLISLLSAYHNLWKEITPEELRTTISDIEKNAGIEDKNNIFDKLLKINNLIKASGIQ